MEAASEEARALLGRGEGDEAVGLKTAFRITLLHVPTGRNVDAEYRHR